MKSGLIRLESLEQAVSGGDPSTHTHKNVHLLLIFIQILETEKKSETILSISAVYSEQ